MSAKNEILAKVIESKYVDFDRMLAELGGGFRLQIYRKEPSWCAGLLHEYDIDPDDPVSADELRRRWGGLRLQAKILTPEGGYGKQRTFNFPDPPRKDYQEVVLGPYGIPTLKTDLEKEQQQQDRNQFLQQSQNNGHGQNALLGELIRAQSSAAQNMQQLLSARINHLESLLENRSHMAASQPQSQSGSAFDAVRDTMKMIKEMENIRAVMGAARGEDPASMAEASPWTNAISKMLDFVLEKEKMSMQQKLQTPMMQAPPLPSRALSAPQTDDSALINSLSNRLKNVDTATKAQLVQAVLGDELDDVLNIIDGVDEENQSCSDNDSDVKSDLVSAEDSALLGDDETTDSNDINE